MNEEIKKIDPCFDEPNCVWLMTYTPEPIRTIFTAVRTCYSPKDQVYLAYDEWYKYSGKPHSTYQNDAIRLLAQVTKLQHLSVLEHVSFTFGIRGVSRSLLAQLTRHRIGFSYSVQSQRYVSFDEKNPFKYSTPPSIKNDKPANGIYKQAMRDIQKAYQNLVDLNIPAEDARYLLPNSALTNVTVTCNLRAFIDLYQKRSDKHAQWEIRELVEKMRDVIIKEVPDMEYLIEGNRS